MELAHNLTDLPPETSCQINKYQSVTDILNPLGLGVKVSFTTPAVSEIMTQKFD
jgi:hypothetical protein